MENQLSSGCELYNFELMSIMDKFWDPEICAILRRT